MTDLLSLSMGITLPGKLYIGRGIPRTHEQYFQECKRTDWDHLQVTATLLHTSAQLCKKFVQKLILTIAPTLCATVECY